MNRLEKTWLFHSTIQALLSIFKNIRIMLCIIISRTETLT